MMAAVGRSNRLGSYHTLGELESSIESNFLPRAVQLSMQSMLTVLFNIGRLGRETSCIADCGALCGNTTAQQQASWYSSEFHERMLLKWPCNGALAVSPGQSRQGF